MFKKISDTKIVAGLVRFSYANVWEPKAIQEGSDPKYSTSILIPKDDTKLVEAIEACVEAAKQDGKSKWGGKIPARLKLPLRDGDEERGDDEAYQGMYFLNASTKNPIQIVDKQASPLMDRAEMYSGAWGRVTLNFYAFDTNGNRGVAVGLGNIQKLKDDSKLGGGSTAAEDFGDMEFEDDDADGMM